MVWRIEVTDSAKKQLARLSRTEATRITGYLRERVSVLDNPRSLGAALQGAQFAGLWRYRVGDYRVMVDIRDQVVTVMVVAIGHRSEVCRQA
ncbi:MAG: type II toxin-antitoxin system RelE/ParE family toxin [Pseudomonadota bacterium]